MNERTLNVLEFDKVISLLIEETATAVGLNKAKKIEPSVSYEEVEELQAETDQAMHVLRLDKHVPFTHMVDVTDSLKRCEIGGILNEEECIGVARLIYAGRQVRNFIDHLEIDIPLIKEITDRIFLFRELERSITGKIDEYGDVLDNASQALRSIRQSIHSYEAKIRERLEHLTRTKSKMLSETIVTIRNNRYVLPVKQAYKGAIGGIVHDQSSSGQTLFMEPKAIIELNNQLQQQITKEKQEIEIILQKLSAEIAEHAESLAVNQSLIADIDVIFARAQLGMRMKASKPEMNKNGIIDLKQARHPLIQLDQVVASDILLGEDYQAMVITGPNTGGKTVTLKTIGLMILMAQSGLQIPAQDGARVGFFKKVFADIGDEQSIEQNLSTFSSHMTNIVEIMEEVDETSLVLFDELGAGTDPQEGAALAMALLDEVIARKAIVAATTHYPELKAYGYNRDAVMNASVEFDVETLRPTYRLLMGIPGRSNAFEISNRLGLDKNLIQEAKASVGIDSKNVEHMISALDDSRIQAENELKQANKLRDEAEALKKDLTDAWQAFENKRNKLYEKAEEKAKDALAKAREEAEVIVDEVRHMKDNANFKEHEWIEAKKILDEAQPQLSKTDKQQQPVKSPQKLEIGDTVKHRSLGQIGEILEIKNNNEYVIQIGIMKLTAKKTDIEFVKKKEKEKTEPISHVLTNASASHVKTELDLRGERYEDALLQLEKYIDEALLSGYPQVTIIHGKGTGALRKGVEQFIKQHPHIKNSRLGNQNEGGSGVTILTFK
ncbi:MAG TPA: endonuclease MutS2 [Pseudogracilibacillus sp.]|nr:endonuclease MutS2 [Pseudogracilibacillus sp.]